MKVIKSFLLKKMNFFLVDLTIVSITLLRAYFIDNNTFLQTLLSKLDYHYSIISNPQILFVSKKYNYKKTRYIPEFIVVLLLRLIRKSIKIGIWENGINKNRLRKIGLVEPFCENARLMLQDVHNPVVLYQLNSDYKIKKKVAVYSVVTGNYDIVYDPIYLSQDVDYILFTNNHAVTSEIWNVHYIESDLDNLLLSRHVKMLPQRYLGKDYDCSIYVDANALIHGDIKQLAALLSDNISFAITYHSERCTIKDEIVVCCKKKGINEFDALEQYDRYVKEGFTDELGLPECGILIRRHNDEFLNKVMELWWDEYVNGVRRDQISLMYCIWKTQFIGYKLCQGSVWNNQFCRILSHKKI